MNITIKNDFYLKKNPRNLKGGIFLAGLEIP
jgi:hypothetical protein